MPVRGGGFHIKAGLLEVGGRPYFAAKTTANFPDNPTHHRLPTIQGVIVLADAERGTPLAVMDSMEITSLRGVKVRLGKRSEEHTSELQSHLNLVCRLLLEKKKKEKNINRLR